VIDPAAGSEAAASQTLNPQSVLRRNNPVHIPIHPAAQADRVRSKDDDKALRRSHSRFPPSSRTDLTQLLAWFGAT